MTPCLAGLNKDHVIDISLYYYCIQTSVMIDAPSPAFATHHILPIFSV